MEKLEPLYSTCGNINCAATVVNSLMISGKVKLPNDSAILFIGISPKEWKTSIQTKTCT